MSLGSLSAVALSAQLPPRAEPIRRRTLILIRWVALGGQIIAVSLAWLMGIRFDLAPVLVVIGIGAALNLWMTATTARVTHRGATGQLVFDLIQISMLIGLTGGLSNPFALLVLAPVTIAATALQDRETVLVGAATVVMISLAALLAMPLQHPRLDLSMPPVLQLAHLSAILIGVVFFAAYARRVAGELATTSDALFASQMALAREQKLQHLGGIIAAAAHEMGTPLATIKLIAAELNDELSSALPDRSDLAEDAATLAQSADRCRDILRSMGRAGKDDLKIHAAPLPTVLEEAAQPHADRGTPLRITLPPDGVPPTVMRDPGIIHGLRNIIQNAVDFAETKVEIEASWTDATLMIHVRDDGRGFSQAVLTRLSEPFPVSRRSDRRGSYEGMGLGLFIARSLLESSGATLYFRNRSAQGAEVTVSWPLDRIAADDRAALRENPPIS
ncbi:ActS/PrrB/RegB family redox-sensitive histidine kinase [Paracoccus sediminicola]|uniref:ActS/PrrB/RegB family redox-sensitive histidine kinase n=1 Tax=Paracoccus sediminicola TaxID=3017783 RepID=UPI0022F0BF32|nr:ActS/PrrB/RegB family redox-sensitive histidine kinase [Paracoccus sediminicola]WBU56378.1 ActS/PrrB/RegB family redox-sensitive histidine kinase [Paracoccus sediminicola]